jgi:hypothetical protein
MQPDTIAKDILTYLANDMERSHGRIVRANRSICMEGQGIAGGPWGVALAFAEASRISEFAHWQNLALKLANTEPVTDGRGIFVGIDGRYAAQLAALPSLVTLELPQCQSKRDGDLIDGYLSELWSRECFGVAGPSGQKALAVTDLPEGTPGLAHGPLGGIACMSRQVPAQQLYFLLLKHNPRESLGWCNGIAGTAVASLIAWRSTGLAAFRSLAHRSIEAALGELPLETDGLCHGTAGVLVVAAGVARCTQSASLMQTAVCHARRVWSVPSRRNWRLDRTYQVDQSWLTGVSGIAWALMTLSRPPLVNPLCPVDAVCVSHRESSNYLSALVEHA